MAKAYHEALHPLGNLGIQVSMATLESPHIPAHWHDAMEILFSGFSVFLGNSSA